MAQPDCVIFDIGNVLVRWDPVNLYRKFGFSDAETARIMVETRLAHINHRELDAGAPFGPTIAKLARTFPSHANFIHAFDSRWPEMLAGPIEASVSVLNDLKLAKFPVYAISNFAREKFDITRKLMPFLDSFDELVLSGDEGLVKPDAPIFELLIARRSLDPARAVYIDDSAANIATARGLGFPTVHFIDGQTDLRAQLIELGVPGLVAA